MKKFLICLISLAVACGGSTGADPTDPISNDFDGGYYPSFGNVDYSDCICKIQGDIGLVCSCPDAGKADGNVETGKDSSVPVDSGSDLDGGFDGSIDDSGNPDSGVADGSTDSNDGQVDQDGSFDAGTDAATDAETDSSTDASTDVSVDSGHDSGADAGHCEEEKTVCKQYCQTHYSYCQDLLVACETKCESICNECHSH